MDALLAEPLVRLCEILRNRHGDHLERV